ncbi:hypothetical protein GQ42DRAFT_165622 [Ramicandelaber brevisporus]|nr:hypothetical protein GQ42DRAFT_165622 [Ramicandelaber brevisporus]
MSYWRTEEEGKDTLHFLASEPVVEKDSQPDASATQAAAEQAAAALTGASVEASASGERPALINEQGEINWDCPCLGGMAQGTCGEQFKEAFSCFVYSTEEPKGIDCVDKFIEMRDCFREHPEEYGGLGLDDDDDDDNEDEKSKGAEETTKQ